MKMQLREQCISDEARLLDAIARDDFLTFVQRVFFNLHFCRFLFDSAIYWLSTNYVNNAFEGVVSENQSVTRSINHLHGSLLLCK